MEERLLPYSHMPRWEWNGFVLLEPFTVLTNLLISAVCFYAFARLRPARSLSHPQQMARWFFLGMALATFTGGVLGHGFLYLTGQVGKLPGWFLSMVAVAFFERAAILQAMPYMPAKIGRFFSVMNYVEIAGLMLAAAITLRFIFVEAHATYGLFVVVCCFNWWVHFKTNAPYCRYIFLGSAFAAAAAIVHQSQIGINRWFNYNDVSHLLMTAGVWFYYKGIKAMPDKILVEGSGRTILVPTK
jgi:hypothetical protein